MWCVLGNGESSLALRPRLDEWSRLGTYFQILPYRIGKCVFVFTKGHQLQRDAASKAPVPNRAIVSLNEAADHEAGKASARKGAAPRACKIPCGGAEFQLMRNEEAVGENPGEYFREEVGRIDSRNYLQEVACLLCIFR